MHIFDYKEAPKRILTPEIVNIIASLHEYRGKQQMYMQAKSDVLTSLLDVAMIQSTQSSNKIEGIFTSDDRLKALVAQKAQPKNRSEEEIAGYRQVLALIHENYQFIPIKSNTILQLHRNLYSFNGANSGGSFKNSDNIIAQEGKDGKEYVRFQPIAAFQVPEAMENLCNAFNDAINAQLYDPLLLIPMFILDFLCIHPFNDGNGRMSRLLTLLLLYQHSYIVGKYISLEMLIEKSKETYYEVLQNSSALWHDNMNDYAPFVRYYLGIVLKGYHEFSSRMEYVVNTKLSKAQRIKEVFNSQLGKVTKSDISAQCPDISITTIERTLKELLDSGYIIKAGSGRATGYVKNIR